MMKRIAKTVLSHLGEDLVLFSILTLIGVFFFNEGLTMDELSSTMKIVIAADILFGFLGLIFLAGKYSDRLKKKKTTEAEVL